METLEAAINPGATTHIALPDVDAAPCLATGIEHEFFDLMLFPRDWTLHGIVAFAWGQILLNRLPAAIVLDAESCLFTARDGNLLPGRIFRGDRPFLVGEVLPIVPFQAPAELIQRSEAVLDALTGQPEGPADLGRFKGGRRARPEEIEALAGRAWNGVPIGLEPCAECGEWHGVCLDESGGKGVGPIVLPVRCRCVNHTCCARCRKPFHERAVASAFWDEMAGELGYLSGLAVLEHVCEKA